MISKKQCKWQTYQTCREDKENMHDYKWVVIAIAMIIRPHSQVGLAANPISGVLAPENTTN